MQGKEIPQGVMIGGIVAVLVLVAGIGWWFLTQGDRAQATANPPPPSWIDPVTRKPKGMGGGGSSSPGGPGGSSSPMGGPGSSSPMGGPGGAPGGAPGTGQ